ncbi:MAG: CCA tRNA nucleotidyltransferase [Vulcanococcus sp.]
MPGSGGSAAAVAWSVLRAEDWPVPLSAFPADAALVGGAVRDALLNRLGPAPDLDLVVADGAIALCKTLSKRFGGSPVVLDAERDIGRLVIRGWSVDLARREGQSLADDLQRRDYSVNAMALPLAQRDQLVDPHGGLEHLQRRQLVALAERNLLDDPLRLLRGVRLASELEFELDDTTAGWIQRHRERLSSVAGERVLAELEKLCQSPQGQQGLQRCLDWGLLAPCPALAPLTPLTAEQASNRGLSDQECQEALPLARMAAVLDGTGLQQLKSSRKLQQRVQRLRHWQQRLGAQNPAEHAQALKEAERLQLHRDLSSDLPALLLHWPAPAAKAWLRRWRDPEDRLFHPRAAINGDQLQQELGLKASPQLGSLLQFLMLEQAFGRLDGTAEALERARQWLERDTRRD